MAHTTGYKQLSAKSPTKEELANARLKAAKANVELGLMYFMAQHKAGDPTRSCFIVADDLGDEEKQELIRPYIESEDPWPWVGWRRGPNGDERLTFSIESEWGTVSSLRWFASLLREDGEGWFWDGRGSCKVLSTTVSASAEEAAETKCEFVRTVLREGCPPRHEYLVRPE